MALALDQVRAGLCERRGERGVRGEHGAPHLAAGGQPHHRMRRTPPTPRIGNIAKRECHMVISHGKIACCPSSTIFTP